MLKGLKCLKEIVTAVKVSNSDDPEDQEMSRPIKKSGIITGIKFRRA